MVGDFPAALTQHCGWLRLRGLRETTITQRRYALLRLARYLDPLTATADDLDAWQQTLHMTPVGRCTELMHVSQFYAWALTYGLIDDDPTIYLVRPRKPRSLPRPIAEGDLVTALACAVQPVRAMMYLAAFAGLRAGEIARLQRHDIHDSAVPPVLIIDGKGGKERVVPAAPLVLDELRAFGLPSRGFVFRLVNGAPMTPCRVSQLVNAHLHELGIPSTCHSLRHRFGTRLYHLSASDLRMVQEVLGHNDPATTAGYVAYSPGRAVDAVNALAESMPVRRSLRVVPPG